MVSICIGIIRKNGPGVAYFWRSRDLSPFVSLGIFFHSIRHVYVPGVDSASKNEYQDIPGGKGGRCVGVTTLPPSAECLVILTSRTRPGHVGL